MNTKRALAAVLLGVAASGVCLALALRNVSLAAAWQTIRHLRPALLLWPIAVSIANLCFRAWRWQQIFPGDARPRYSTCFQVLAMSLALNNFLPGRGGDLARCVLVNRRVSAGESTVALATLGLEKLFDTIALLVVVLYSFLVLTPPAWLRELGFFSALVVAVTIAFIVALRYYSSSALDFVRRCASLVRLPAWGDRAAALLQSFADGLRAVSSLAQVFLLLLQTAAIWTLEALLFWVFARVLGLSLSLSGSVVASGILGLGLMIPAAPAAVGTYEFFSTSALKLMGVAAAPALALTVLLHAWVLLCTSVFGLAAMTTAGFRLAELRPPAEPQRAGVAAQGG